MALRLIYDRKAKSLWLFGDGMATEFTNHAVYFAGQFRHFAAMVPT